MKKEISLVELRKSQCSKLLRSIFGSRLVLTSHENRFCEELFLAIEEDNFDRFDDKTVMRLELIKKKADLLPDM